LVINEGIKYEPDDSDETEHTEYRYISDVRRIKERFDVMGYSTKNTKR